MDRKKKKEEQQRRDTKLRKDNRASAKREKNDAIVIKTDGRERTRKS